jgi:two-component system chemotaxis response regulator CheY
MVTSATDSATVDQAAGLGVNGYLVKPFKGDEVQTFMAPFSAAPAALDETPQASMQRLGISGERLLVYLGGFQAQVAGAGAEITALLAGGDVGAARQRLERLHAGCLTLGLNRAAAQLGGFAQGGPIDGARVQQALTDTVGAVMRQEEAARRLPAPA